LQPTNSFDKLTFLESAECTDFTDNSAQITDYCPKKKPPKIPQSPVFMFEVIHYHFSLSLAFGSELDTVICQCQICEKTKNNVRIQKKLPIYNKSKRTKEQQQQQIMVMV
jgi:hypothetical protein